MAISKLILNGEVQMDVTSDTVEANKLLSGETATKNDGTKVTGTYVAQNPVISSLSVTPTESAQTFNEASISGYKPVTVGAIASDYVGSAVPLRDSADMAQDHTQVYTPSGYYSETARYNLTTYSHLAPEIWLQKSTGYVYAEHNAYDAIMADPPGILRGEAYTQSMYQLSTLSAQTIIPSESVQYISSYQWLTGSQTIAPINITSLSVTPTEEQQVFNETAKSLVQTGSSIAGSTERPTLPLVVGKQYILRLIDAADTMGYSCIDSIDEKEYTFTWDGQEKTHRFQGYGTNRISVRITENNTIFISSYSGIEYISWELYVENMVDGYLPVTVNAIPSSYIIPSGTYSVTENGIYDIGSYASVDVSVGGGDTAIEDAVIGGIPAAVNIYSNDRITSIRAYACQAINASVFDVPNVSNIGPYAFTGNSYVNTVLTSKLLGVGTYAFSNCKNLENIDLSPVLSISACAFVSAKLSSSLTLSYLVSMNDNVFENCDSLPSVALPYYNRPISYSTFYHCSVLSEFYAPFATAIHSLAFNQCSRLTKCNIITAWTISSSAFVGCVNLSSIVFCATRGAVTINQYAFSGCNKLHDVYICNRLSGSGTIQAYAFSDCTSLSNLYILSPSYVSLTNSTAFRNTPISYSATGYGSIYVPAALYDSYISGANWSYFSDRFVSLTSSEVDAIFDSLSEVNLWSYKEADPTRSISSRQLINNYKSLNQLIGKQAEYKLLLNDNPGGQTANYLYSMAIFSQILLQSYTTFTAVRPSLSLNFSLCVDLENNTVLYNFNSGRIYGFSFWIRCL